MAFLTWKEQDNVSEPLCISFVEVVVARAMLVSELSSEVARDDEACRVREAVYRRDDGGEHVAHVRVNAEHADHRKRRLDRVPHQPDDRPACPNEEGADPEKVESKDVPAVHCRISELDQLAIEDL
eukprot:6199432-Pleurochrysis_carterae.AAC.4